MEHPGQTTTEFPQGQGEACPYPGLGKRQAGTAGMGEGCLVLVGGRGGRWRAQVEALTNVTSQ